MTENNVPDTLFQLILVGIRVDLESILDYHTIVAVELRPLAVVRVLVEPRPVQLLYRLEVLGDTLHVLADNVVLIVSALH